MQTATTNTWNRALSNASTKSFLLDFYYKVLRQTPESEVKRLLAACWSLDRINTFKLIFQLRDCRGGKGERRAFRWCLEWLVYNGFTEWVLINLKNIPEFGTFQDLTVLMTPDMPDILVNAVYKLWAQVLVMDIDAMKDKKPVSLAAKWFPKEGRSFDRKYGSAKRLATLMGISTKQLRKAILVPLNQYLDVVEVKMCAKEWEQITYSKVPSVSMKNLNKAFERHDPEGFSSFMSSVEKGGQKINANLLFPYQLVQGYNQIGNIDPVREEQWKVLVKGATALSNCLVMVDTSASMTFSYSSKSNVLPIDVAVSLGLLSASVLKEPFNKLILTFSETPEFVEIPNGSLLEQIRSLRGINENTNFQAALDLILKKAIQAEVDPQDMPRRLLVISDMQFDQAENIWGNQERTNFQIAQEKYQKSGYDVPALIFWNVNGSTSDTPVTMSDEGAILISGFSPSVLKYLISEDDFGPDMVLKQILSDERYDILRVPVSNKVHDAARSSWDQTTIQPDPKRKPLPLN